MEKYMSVSEILSSYGCWISVSQTVSHRLTDCLELSQADRTQEVETPTNN